ncbi:Hypothetical Protein FCC1311_066242 [Hondaea fermentalgiana]|uniref:Calcineurin-like phosphoesterase domain-containing protein n=1 Tax=Hondaea fermentalgiana TaxID=2315210 RepID=A0A2R5GII1_9STRA|nr:Hypothetical Protein FCC1311_066242 [Hondaea fermentalgiana]|eukprot:GBG30405.1 Hypothetical Protein FCC1311_066242 [Hondaea fermentalgiana]
MESPLIQPPEPNAEAASANSDGSIWPVLPSSFGFALDNGEQFPVTAGPSQQQQQQQQQQYCPKRKANSSGARSAANRAMIWIHYHSALACVYLLTVGVIFATAALMYAAQQRDDPFSKHLRDPSNMYTGYPEPLLVVDTNVTRRNVTRVAIFADSAINEATKRVLRLIHDENADMVLHPGDIDYTGDVSRWQTQMTSILGADFPYFFSAGNYEMKIPKSRRGKPDAVEGEQWGNYVAKRDEILRANGVVCPFATPSRSQLAYRMDTLKENRAFLRNALLRLRESFPATRWTFCMWHAPFTLMQVGFRDPPDVMGSSELEAAYDDCRAAGAVVLTGHEHYYVRTHTMSSFKQPYGFDMPTTTEDEDLPLLYARPGNNFAVVSGLGGHSVSVPCKSNFERRAHLAAVHPLHMLTDTDPGGKIFYSEVSGRPTTSSELIEFDAKTGLGQGYPFGALFCELPIGSLDAEAPAYCYFKTIDGEIVDQFLVAGSFRQTLDDACIMGFFKRAKAQVYADPYDPEDIDAEREPNKSLERRRRELKYAMLAAVEFHAEHEVRLRKFCDGVKERNHQDRKKEWLRAKKRELKRLGLPIKPEALVQAVKEQEAIGFPLIRGDQIEDDKNDPSDSEDEDDQDAKQGQTEDELDLNKDDERLREFIQHEDIFEVWEQSVKSHRDAFEQSTIVPLEEVFDSKHWKAGAVQAKKKYLELLARPVLKEEAVKSLARVVAVLDVYRDLNIRLKKGLVDQADREQREETALKSKLHNLQEELRILELHKQARSTQR